jgi:hypothetical protein
MGDPLLIIAAARAVVACRANVQMSPVCQFDGVTGQQPPAVAAVAVPHSDEIGMK